MTHRLFPSARFSLAEARLLSYDVRENPARAAESVAAAKDLRENAVIKDALVPYQRNPALKDPVDRGYFFAVTLDNMLPSGDPDYRTIRSRRDVKGPLPDGILPIDFRTKTHEEIGLHLASFMDKKRLELLGKGPDEQGDNFLKRLNKAEADWNAGDERRDPLLADATIDYYKTARATLDQFLQERHILVPEQQTTDLGIGENLQRDEYLSMLSLVWKGGNAVALLREAHDDGYDGKKGIAGLRGFIASLDRRSVRIYSDRAFEELGPREGLRRFGVELGPHLHKEYVDLIQGKLKLEDAGAKLLGSGDTAATWLMHPERAFLFLQKSRLPPTEGNARFLDALNWHVGRTHPIDGVVHLKTPPPGMDEHDVRALLNVVSNSLVEYEKAVVQNNVSREKMIRTQGIDTSIEKYGADLWEYMLNIRDHPIGSGILWIAAGGTALAIWNFITLPRKRWQRWLGIGAFAAAGYGLYQKHKEGKAWWDDSLTAFNDWRMKDKQRPPEEQTLVNHLAGRLNVKDGWLLDNLPGAKRKHGEACLAVLQDQPADMVFDWFEKMQKWEKNGADPKLVTSMAPMPFKVGSRYRNMFGEMNTRDKSILFYNVMKQFCADRGDYVLKHHLEAFVPTGVTDNVSVGFNYLRDKYVKKTWFTAIAGAVIDKLSIELDESWIDLGTWDPADPRAVALKTKSPRAYAVIEEVLATHKQESMPRDTGMWDMMHVFFNEADPEILRRTGRDGTVPAGLLERMYASAKSLVKPYTPVPPGPTAAFAPGATASPPPGPASTAPTGPSRAVPSGPSTSVPPGPTVPTAPGATPGSVAGPSASVPSGPTIPSAPGSTATITTGPTTMPAVGPTSSAAGGPTALPGTAPTTLPAVGSTAAPSTAPTAVPSIAPTPASGGAPASRPTTPTFRPRTAPTPSPTAGPTEIEAEDPTSDPSKSPTPRRSSGPTSF